MAGGYKEELEAEMKLADPNSHASRLVAQEIDRLNKGGEDEKKDEPKSNLISIHDERPQKNSVKVRIPIKEHPRYNFVGKLLGPKGATLKELQQQTGCKMAIMGRGSMREKDKEEELRKEGGKYAHLNEDLHVMVECFTEATDGYHRIAAALVEVKKFLIPELAEEHGYGGHEMGSGDMGMNGSGAPAAPRGRGAFRGAPAERGSRGGFRGRGAGGPPAGRGAPPSGRGGAPRGGPRGGPAPRGAPSARGARPAPPAAQSYEGGYGAQEQGYGSGGYGGQYESYEEGYSGRTAADQSYDYYGGQQSGQGYESYGAEGGYGYGESYQAKPAPAPARGGARGGARAHPYGRQQQSGY